MIDFILGENKYVKFAVRSRKQEPFAIRAASWELYHNGLLECSGECEIEKQGAELYLQIMLAPEHRSKKYQLCITYQTGEEICKHTENMEVR